MSNAFICFLGSVLGSFLGNFLFWLGYVGISSLRDLPFLLEAMK